MEQQQLLHFSHSKHPLVYVQHFRGRATCCGCQESVYGPSYFCPNSKCSSWHCHHKLCAEVPLGLHHPLHPLHPLILFDEKTGYLEKENSTCQVCNESRNEYTYRCYHCDFNLHIKCAILQLETEFHDHPLTPIGKTITFTCDICGKEGKEAALLSHVDSRLYITSIPSTSPILLLNSVNPTPDFVYSVFKRWTHATAFTIAPNAILFLTSINKWKTTYQSYIKARARDAASLSSVDWENGNIHGEFSEIPI
ncbi:hypothetical protein CFP56_043387 [Quercus suber]|uniref:DC1 domain-containing protein n=1 Tax=Quercus suber TaxID=58331 RepID=A0AAW0IRU5_QUESU